MIHTVTLCSRTARINPVKPTIQLMRIGATSPPHELHGGSRGDGASPNLGIATRSCPTSSPDLGESSY